jgi:hypothetical protein
MSVQNTADDSTTVGKLQIILSNITTNRKRLVEEMNVQEQQREVNVTQLAHFDTIIAAIQTSLGDANALANIEKLVAQGVHDEPEQSQLPLGTAGAGAETAPAPAAANG